MPCRDETQKSDKQMQCIKLSTTTKPSRTCPKDCGWSKGHRDWASCHNGMSFCNFGYGSSWRGNRLQCTDECCQSSIERRADRWCPGKKSSQLSMNKPIFPLQKSPALSYGITVKWRRRFSQRLLTWFLLSTLVQTTFLMPSETVLAMLVTVIRCGQELLQLLHIASKWHAFEKFPPSLRFLLAEIPKWFSKSTVRREAYKML